MEDDDDDDTHLCMRCSANIIGLDNYVAHRKSFCSTTKLINKTRTGPGVTLEVGNGDVEVVRTEGTSRSGVVVPLEATTTTTEQEIKTSEGVLPKPGLEAEEGRRKETARTSSGVINNKDQLKCKAPLVVGQPATRHRDGFGSFVDDDEHNHHQHQESTYSASKTSLGKSLEYDLDYDSIDDDVPSSPSRVVAGSRTEGEYDYEGANLFFQSLQLQSSSKPVPSKRGHDNPIVGTAMMKEAANVGRKICPVLLSAPLSMNHRTATKTTLTRRVTFASLWTKSITIQRIWSMKRRITEHRQGRIREESGSQMTITLQQPWSPPHNP